MDMGIATTLYCAARFDRREPDATGNVHAGHLGWSEALERLVDKLRALRFEGTPKLLTRSSQEQLRTLGSRTL